MNISGISGAGGSWFVNSTNTSATISTSQQAGPFASLDLTQTQQQQIAQILQNAQSQGLSPSQVQSQINSVLTASQRQQLQSQIGQQQAGPFANLNLTQTQQQQIAQILQNAQSQGLSPSQVQSQINAVLTASQRQQLQSEIGQHKHHHGSSSGSSSIGNQTDAFGIPTSISSGSSSATQTISDIAASFWSQSQQQQNGNS